MRKYSIVTGVYGNVDNEACTSYGIACGELIIEDICCEKEPVEELVDSLNFCVLPVEYLWKVVENWVDKYGSITCR